ncbi:hypothetical protein H5410_031383 [Solanum commersonii]|uniref:Uncharacterized protein n=1 Tax=Solanum commersonii TaxID=4109 RepID=A0A9J5YJ03_SOLCO|nr:hypothetical protein H5410_031383 [Solanum commersonii]
MDRHWVTMGRGRNNNTRGRLSPGSSYGSSSSSLVIQMGRRIHLEDIPKNSLLYAQLQAYLFHKQSDTFASIAKEYNDDIKYYEKTILISTGGVEFQHFSGCNTSKNAYNFSKMIIKQIISVEDWGISTMKERQISLNKIATSFTYWDYIHAFDKVLYYNNDRHKHTWFIKICAKIFAGSIPN